MRLIRILLATVFMVVCSSSMLVAQMRIMPGGKKIVLGKDTLCFRYHFAVGDTLVYSLESRDSIDIERRGILAKSRSEKFQIVCDSALGGRYTLSMTTLRASEYQANTQDTVFRPGHPWVGRVVTMVIDSLGHRIDQRSGSSLAAMCPGGAFQPLRLPILDSSCGRQNQSWLSEDTVSYSENAVPFPVMNQQVLWRVGDYLDTLGRATKWIMYSLTGFGFVDMTASQLAMQTTSKVAESGRIVFDRSLQVPLIATIQQDNRFTVESASGSRPKTSGKHLMVVTMELDRLSSKDPSRRWSRSSAAPSRAGRRQRK
jgi:hypothetical protein